jgi:hypothetical protein
LKFSNTYKTSPERATAGIQAIKTCRMEKNLSSRLLKYMNRNKKLIVSQKSPTSAYSRVIA